MAKQKLKLTQDPRNARLHDDRNKAAMLAGMNVEHIQVADLVPYAKNSKMHNDAQVAAIAGSIREFGFNNPVLVDSAGGIIAGHGRVMAARKLGLDTVPCIRLGHLSDSQKRAYILADNRLGEIGGGWDDEMLRIELSDLSEIDIPFDALGWTDTELAEILGSKASCTGDHPLEEDVKYTNKIKIPIYEPTGECPDLSMLIDRVKTEKLISNINASSLPDDIKIFMRYAAERHTVFNFRHIAEYYCHASEELQQLMEQSGMVIIDIKKAIEYGFVHLTERLGTLAQLEDGEENEEETN